MAPNNLKSLEEKIKVLEFKLELVLKFTKCNINLSLNNCKTMDELAFITGLNKDEYNKINDLLSSQINFFKSFKHSNYVSPRQFPRIEDDIDVFQAFSKEDYENKILETAPVLKEHPMICEKIAQINDIHDLYYGPLAIEIRKEKNERLDKETKLLNSYKDNKNEIDGIFNEFSLLKDELNNNLKQSNDILEFFEKNELAKISIFYNGELWEISEDDKKVVINENSYIHNVCKFENKIILDKIDNILKDKKCEYHDLIVHILKSSPTSSKKIEDLQNFYKEMEIYNKNEYIEKNELFAFKEKIAIHINICEEILSNYQEYINNIK